MQQAHDIGFLRIHARHFFRDPAGIVRTDHTMLFPGAGVILYRNFQFMLRLFNCQHFIHLFFFVIHHILQKHQNNCHSEPVRTLAWESPLITGDCHTSDIGHWFAMTA